MPVVVTTEPATEPVSLAEAKEHLREVDASQNSYITNLIVAARRAIELQIQRALITRELRLTLDSFPCGRTIALPYAPLQEVDQVLYLDSNDAQQTLDAATYLVRPQFTPGHIYLKRNQSWPSTSSNGAAVMVDYTAGYGDAGTDVPGDIRQGILILVAHYYANREITVTGQAVSELPRAVDALVMPYRVWT